MSQSSWRIERRSEEFDIQDYPGIDPTAPKIKTLDQYTINSLVGDIIQVAATADPPDLGGAAPAPAPIDEKIIEYSYITGISTDTSDGKNFFQDTKKELSFKCLITVKANNVRHFDSGIKKQ